MGVNEIATKADISALMEFMKLQMKEFRAMANKAGDKQMSVDEVAAFVGHDRKTVMKWIKEGKDDDQGRNVKLPARQFSVGIYRISINDLLWYGEIGCYELVK